jgi:hypothetical protein
MDYSLIRVKMEKVIGDELYELIDGKIIEYIINEGKIEIQNRQDSIFNLILQKDIVNGINFKAKK